MRVYFQKASKSLLDRLIKLVTKSKYVHCEISFEWEEDCFLGYTSLAFKGVCSDWIDYSPDEWDFLEVPGDSQTVLKFYEKTKGRGYDYLGVLGFVFGNPDNPRRYFCSEWCATVMGIPNPSKISPGELYKLLESKKI